MLTKDDLQHIKLFINASTNSVRKIINKGLIEIVDSLAVRLTKGIYQLVNNANQYYP